MFEKESRAIQSIIKLKHGSNVENISLISEQYFSPFSTPIQILYLLLQKRTRNGTRYCHRRSGKYYERLCIDLEQAGMWTIALRECSNAIHDPFVKV